MAVAMLDVCCMAKARKRWGSLMTVSRAWSLASTLLVVSAVKPERQKACLTYHAKDAFTCADRCPAAASPRCFPRKALSVQRISPSMCPRGDMVSGARSHVISPI